MVEQETSGLLGAVSERMFLVALLGVLVVPAVLVLTDIHKGSPNLLFHKCMLLECFIFLTLKGAALFREERHM